MKTNPKFFDESFKISRSINNVYRTDCPGIGWGHYGTVTTPYGIVSVQADALGNGRGFTRLDFAHGGRHYIRNYKRFYSIRGMSTLASRFAKFVHHNGAR